MYQFKHEFRELRDYDGYGGCLNLPNGEKPIICQVTTDDENIDIILSGSGAEEVIITLVRDGLEYILVLPEYNMVPIVVVDAMVEYLEDNRPRLWSAAEDIICDYNMDKYLSE